MAKHYTKSVILLIKAISMDQIFVSCKDGESSVRSATDLREISKLDIGQYNAYSVISIQNLLLVGSSHLHIFDKDNQFQKVDAHFFGEYLNAMSLLNSQDTDKTQFILCGTYKGKVFLFKASNEP